jgi:hypothetical protein
MPSFVGWPSLLAGLMRGIRLARLVTLCASIVVAVIQPAHAQRSQAMSFECRRVQTNRQKADQWVQQKLKAFLPTPEHTLRMRSLERQAAQVNLAFYGIRSTCEQYLAGKITKNDADLTLSGFEQTIKDFLHDIGNEALLLAAKGQVSDIDAIRSTLTDIGAVGRQAALLGDDALAEQSYKKLVNALVSFSSTFVEHSCWDQSFDDELPYSIQRQNELLGTGIDVLPCAKRRFTAGVGTLTFESCTVRGVGDWRVRWMRSNLAVPGSTGGQGSGELKPDKDRAKGDYKVDWGANGVEYRASGKMELARRDSGPGRKATYTLSGDTDIRLTQGKELISMFEKLMKQETKPGKSSFNVEPSVSDKPCKSLEE